MAGLSRLSTFALVDGLFLFAFDFLTRGIEGPGPHYSKRPAAEVQHTLTHLAVAIAIWKVVA